MLKQSRAVSVLLVGMLFLGLMAADAFGDFINLSPDSLSIDISIIGWTRMTVTIDEPSLTEEVKVALTSSSAVFSVPDYLYIHPGDISGTFIVTPITIGSGFVTATLGSYSDTSTVLVYEPSTVPIPPTVWLLGSGLIGLVGMRKRFTSYLKK